MYVQRLMAALPLCKTTVSLAMAHLDVLLFTCCSYACWLRSKFVDQQLIKVGDRKEAKSALSLFLVVVVVTLVSGGLGGASDEGCGQWE